MNANRRVPDDPASEIPAGNGAQARRAADPCTLHRQQRRYPERNGLDGVQEEAADRDGANPRFAGETSPQGKCSRHHRDAETCSGQEAAGDRDSRRRNPGDGNSPALQESAHGQGDHRQDEEKEGDSGFGKFNMENDVQDDER